MPPSWLCPPPDTGELEKLFRYEVFKMLKVEGKITDVIIENMMNWRHSGLEVYCGKANQAYFRDQTTIGSD